MVSVILPSIRPRNLKFCVERFIKTQKDIDYELIIIVDFCVIPIDPRILNKARKIVWIYMKEREGCVQAIQRGFEVSTGEYIFILNDMAEVTPDGLRKMLNFSKMYGDKIVVNQHTVPTTKLEYYGKVFAPYPFVHRDIVKKLGGFFLPIYKSFYADPDFSMRAHEAKVPILKCPDVTVYRHSPQRFLGLRLTYEGHIDNVNKYCEQDKQMFIKQWAHLGIPHKEPDEN